MNTIISLQNKAIDSAKKADWLGAKSINEEILSLEENNISALNRLAVCHLQLNEVDQATSCFNRVLELDPANSIASKQLANIKQNTIKTPTFSSQHFIEEPGRSKVVTLHRLAAKNILEKLHIGQQLFLKPKSRYISIETTEKIYIGSLPEDISLRLAKLITGGNEYQCQVHSCCHNACSVFVKETHRSPENQEKLSFIVNKKNNEDSELDDEIFLGNNIPLNIHDSDTDRVTQEADISNLDEDRNR